MTETPQQPITALTEDEQKTVRSAAVRAGVLVAQAEPGFFDTFKESFAASKAVKAASPEVRKLVIGGLPEMPSGGKDEVNARTLELLKQAVGVMNVARSLARKTAAFATSWGRPNRGQGVC